MHAMPGNPPPEGAAPTSMSAESVSAGAPTRADAVLGALADELAADVLRSAAATAAAATTARATAAAAVPEPRGGVGSGPDGDSAAGGGVVDGGAADGRVVDGGAADGGGADGGADAQAVPGDADDDEAARVAAYEASILAAYGGRRGLAEIGLPTMVFVGVYTATSKLTVSLWTAVAISAVLSLWRLVRREKVQNAISGVIGVVVCALFARHTGQAKDFYLPGVLLNIGEALLFGMSVLIRWPIVGVVLGPITGEMMAWRAHPARLRAFTRATWLLAAMFVFRVFVEVPLYLSNQTTALGAAKVLLGYPLYLMVLFMAWQIIRKAPPPARAQES
jgi:hypothetical protein